MATVVVMRLLRLVSAVALVEASSVIKPVTVVIAEARVVCSLLIAL